MHAPSSAASDIGPVAASIRPQPAHHERGRASEHALRELARRQHGVLTTAQIVAAGLSPRAIRARAAAGRLLRLHRGVYAVDPPGARGRSMAAVLACGAGAVVSHRSAAALWGFCEDRGSVDVVAPTRAGRSRAGIAVHRADRLAPDDLAHHDGIPCTAPARTLLDLAGVTDRRTLERAIDRAEELRRFDLDALRDLLERNAGARGRRALRTVLAEYERPTTTRSEAEEALLALIVAAGLPAPRVNEWIPLAEGSGYEADFLWPSRRLIVEVDSRTHHARREAFAHDRQRDRRLALAGYETRRYAAGELRSRPRQVVAELSQFLAA